MIKFNCPYCAFRIEVEDQFAGKMGRCKQCGGEIMAPEKEAPTGLDALVSAPDAPPEHFRIYGTAADEQWVDPAANAKKPAKKKPEAFKLVLPDLPEEIRLKINARRRRTIQYVVAAIVATAIVIVLVLPYIVPEPKPPEEPRVIEPVPQFGASETP